MFPWLPFLSLHDGDPNYQSKRRQKSGSRKHLSLSSVWLNVDCGEDVGSVRVEYLPVPFRPHRFIATASNSTDLGFGSNTVTIASENRADSAPLGDVVPQGVSQQQHQKRSGPCPEASNTRSPRSASVSNSRPGSANSQLPPQPPLPVFPSQPRANRRARMFETSAAMLEIFGGASTSQADRDQTKPSHSKNIVEPPSASVAPASVCNDSTQQMNGSSTALVVGFEQSDQSQATSAALQQAPSTPSISNSTERSQFAQAQATSATLQQAPSTPPTSSSTEQPQFAQVQTASVALQQAPSTPPTLNSTERSQLAQVQAASATFQQIPSAPPTTNGTERPQFGRTDALAREGISKTEWESVKPQPAAASSSFQTIPDHESRYNEAKHRGNWEGAQSAFNLLNQYTQREISPLQQQHQASSSCPVEDELRQRHRLTHLSGENTSETTRNRNNLVCPLELSSQVAQNGHPATEIQQQRRQRREGVAEILGAGESVWQRERAAQCVSRPADAAGEPSTSANGVLATAEKHRVDPPYSEQPNGGSPFDLQAQTSQSANSAACFQEESQLNGTYQPQLNGKSLPDGDTRQKQRKLALSFAEDGSGMVAASGNGDGGVSTTPILIRNGTIVNDEAVFAADVLIEDGQIKQILPGIEAPANAEVINADGLWLLPAGIDLHCELKSGDDVAHGTKSALSGGTTTIVNLVRTTSEDESLLTAYDRSKALIDSKAECNVALSVQIRRWTSAVKIQAEEICQKRGVNSFLLDMDSDTELFEAMECLKRLGALCRVLPENKSIVALLEKQFAALQPSDAYSKSRPAQVEASYINHFCILSQLTNAPFSVLSTGSSEACQAVQTGRQKGALVSAEVPISALASDLSTSSSLQSRVPVRPGCNNQQDALELLANGSLSVCVSGHSSIQRGRIAIGTLAAGERLSLLWEKAVGNGLIDMMRFVAVTSTNAAKILNLYPKKGRIAVGADADLVVWNPQTSHKILTQNQDDKSNFYGLTVNAAPELTIYGGRIVFRNGRLSPRKPTDSHFLILQPCSPHIFSIVQLREKSVNQVKPPVEQRKDSAASNDSSGGIDVRPNSRGKGNALQDNAQQAEKQRSITKVIHPPGGRSTGFW